LVSLAESDHSTAVVAHQRRPIFGFQFHPEHHTDTTYGDEIFYNTYRLLVSAES
jgi:anthranilate/para-aminobenzoate synthase component II